MDTIDLLGWAATAVLIATLWRQIWKQWTAEDPEAVSTWLFVGQITASCCSSPTARQPDRWSLS